MGKYIKLKNLFYLIHDSITVRYNIICQSNQLEKYSLYLL